MKDTQKQRKEPIKLQYCLYVRKSTESEERQVMSIDSQIKEMLQISERENLEITGIKQESHSAKNTGQRPVFNELLLEIQDGKYDNEIKNQKTEVDPEKAKELKEFF